MSISVGTKISRVLVWRKQGSEEITYLTAIKPYHVWGNKADAKPIGLQTARKMVRVLNAEVGSMSSICYGWEWFHKEQK